MMKLVVSEEKTHCSVPPSPLQSRLSSDIATSPNMLVFHTPPSEQNSASNEPHLMRSQLDSMLSGDSLDLREVYGERKATREKMVAFLKESQPSQNQDDAAEEFAGRLD